MTRAPSVQFGALLDDEKGGHFRIRPADGTYTTKQLYFPDTAVLITRFLSEAGVGEVVDFMPPAGGEATGNHRLVRMVRCVRGDMSFAVDIAPRFDYGRRNHRTDLTASDRPRSGSCSTTRSRSGARGCPGRPTRGGGGRRCTAPRSH